MVDLASLISENGGPKRHKSVDIGHDARKGLISHRHFTMHNEYALTLMILRMSAVETADSNQRPFEQAGGNQLSLECLDRLQKISAAGS